MEIVLESLREQWQALLVRAPYIAAGLVVLLVTILAGRIVARGLVRVLNRSNFSPTHKEFFRKLTVWVFAFVGFIMTLEIVGLERVATSILAGGGITAVILGFAFRDVGENLLAGLFLAFNRPFDVGDLIRSGEFEGLVRGVDIRHTHIRAADGRDIFIPSGRIFNDPLVNYTRDRLRRPSFTVGIDYADDTENARRFLLETVRRVDGVLERPAPGVVVSGMTPQYVELTVFFWVSTADNELTLGEVRSRVMEASRRTLRAQGFTFSSEVTTAIEMGGTRPFSLRVEEEGSPERAPARRSNHGGPP